MNDLDDAYSLAPDRDLAERLVRTLRGCHHGRIWSERCVHCERVGLLARIEDAERTIARCRAALRELEGER